MMGELCAPAAEADEQDDGAVEIQEQVEPLKIAPSPTLPSPADVEEHRITHTPYRSWCEDCVRGRALGEQRCPPDCPWVVRCVGGIRQWRKH